MGNVLLIGFSEDLKFDSKLYPFSIYMYREDSDRNGRENLSEMRRAVEVPDYVVVNLCKETLPLDEAILIYLLYTNNTPIYGVGNHVDSIMLCELLCRSFTFLHEALDHIKNIF
ncbi:hypothetical protein SAMN05446037_100629 [Anaerovirgula multivorans]|uniref:Uncharacterized protein n=1 Tax=Anaerovirgula multivorans TaxID=312168 RepID=A0A239CMD7_9FIRM|nr:hypothetical protein [Anaerovirgula multivorans]SNS20851.1 hypothetical protein SAMN05446037_100629 [Anaerovirgula multivorans]